MTEPIFSRLAREQRTRAAPDPDDLDVVGDWGPPAGWVPCEDRADPDSWDDPAILDRPYGGHQ